MPGREKLMNFKGNLFKLFPVCETVLYILTFKGNRATSYCPYCYIHGIHNRAIYCPLNPPTNPPQGVDTSTWMSYQTDNLPLRDDEFSRKVAKHIVDTADDKAAQRFGIRGPCC